MYLKKLSIIHTVVFYFLISITTTLITSALVLAESPVGAFTLSPFIGQYLFDGDQHIKSRPIYGLRTGYNLTTNGSIEAMFAYINTKSTTIDNRRINIFRYGIDGQYRFLISNKNLTPFISAGIGAIGFNNPSGINNYSYGVINYGPGIIWTYYDKMGLRADLRHSIVSNNRYSNYEGTIGLIFLFGGDKPAAGPIKPTETKEETKNESASSSSYQKFQVPIVELSDTHFKFDSSVLSQEGQNELNRTILRLKNNPKIKVRIEGHASAAGTVEYNQKLSERRADAVKTHLINQGNIMPDRITTMGYGESKPIMRESHPEKIDSKAAKANMVTLEFENIDNSL